MVEPFIRVRHSKKAVANEIVGHLPRSFQRFIDATPTDLSVLAVQPRSPKRTVIQAPTAGLELLVEAIRTDWQAVAREAKILWQDLSREEFESVSASDLPADPTPAAAQLLYLNQLSRTGETTYDPQHRAAQYDWNLLKHWSTALDGVKIAPESALDALQAARDTDLVYVDTSAEIGLQEAAQVAQSSPGMVMLLEPAPEEASAFDGMTAHVLERKRPGLRFPDVVHVNW